MKPIVLILILLDVSLGELRADLKIGIRAVLILILLDVSLGVVETNLQWCILQS